MTRTDLFSALQRVGIGRTWVARPVAVGIALFARAITAVRATWQDGAAIQRPCVYFANHSSHGDFILVWTVLPPRLRRRTRPVAAAEYWLKSPVNGFIGRDVFNAVLIERERGARTSDPIAQMAAAIDDGASLILFPEGTRNQTGEPLLPFKSGLFHLARARPDVPLVPVWIDNLNRVMPKGEFVPIPFLCTVTFGEGLTMVPDETKEAFLARTQAALLALAPKHGERGE